MKRLQRLEINPHGQTRNGNSTKMVTYVKQTRWKDVALCVEDPDPRVVVPKGYRIIDDETGEIVR